jgi:hypothetical protein
MFGVDLQQRGIFLDFSSLEFACTPLRVEGLARPDIIRNRIELAGESRGREN